MNLNWLKLKGTVRSAFQNIPYNPILPSGDSSLYFGTYEGQRYGQFDTDCCWDFSACELAETRLEMFWKMGLIPQETKDWLTKNGYIDSDGDFYLSRRWVAILSGVRDGGNDPLDFWRIASSAGLIPNRMLPYDAKEAMKWVTKDDFDNEYFNPQVITEEMESMGREFARRFKIMAENLDGGYFSNISNDLKKYLQEGSLQIGHPVPQDGSWNTVFVNTPKGRIVADHATELYRFDPALPYPYFDYDSYEPHLKQLRADYYIPLITRVSITPNPIPEPVVPTQTTWDTIWQVIIDIIRSFTKSTPVVGLS